MEASMALADISTIIGIIAALFAALGFVWKYIAKPLWKTNLRLMSAIDIIEKIKEEFKPNGGSTLRDAINRIETRLLLEEHARRATSMILDVGIFETDGSGSCKWINRKFSELSGLAQSEAEGFGWINSIHFDDRERIVGEWTDAIKQKRAFNSYFKFVSNNPFSPNDESVVTKILVYAVPAIINENLFGYIGIVTPEQDGRA